MKANFILTPDTYQTFINRFNKLLSISGAVESIGYYKGRKNSRRILHNAKVYACISAITQTKKQYVLAAKIEFDSYPSCQNIYTSEGIIIRPSSDCCQVYYWGTKFHFTSNRIYELSSIKKDEIIKGRQSAKSVFMVCSNPEFVKEQIEFEEEQAEAYWNDSRNFDF